MDRNPISKIDVCGHADSNGKTNFSFTLKQENRNTFTVSIKHKTCDSINGRKMILRSKKIRTPKIDEPVQLDVDVNKSGLFVYNVLLL